MSEQPKCVYESSRQLANDIAETVRGIVDARLREEMAREFRWYSNPTPERAEELRAEEKAEKARYTAAEQHLSELLYGTRSADPTP